MLRETWEDQYRRLQRSYALLRRVADQNTRDEELQQSDNARDVLYHFCCDALHLRDWVRASGLSQAIRDDVWNLFSVAGQPATASLALAACADIANASKHLVLTKRPYTPGGHATVTDQTQGARFPMTLPVHFAAVHWKVDVGGVEHDAVDLATQAVADWDAWLTGVGLLPLPT
jgi:hypothetical protein